jgi:hypothetical protein
MRYERGECLRRLGGSLPKRSRVSAERASNSDFHHRRGFAEVRDEIARVLETESATNTWLRQNPARLKAPYLQGYLSR